MANLVYVNCFTMCHTVQLRISDTTSFISAHGHFIHPKLFRKTGHSSQFIPILQPDTQAVAESPD